MRGAWFLLVVLLLVATAAADVLVLKDGRRVDGTIVSETADKIRIKTSFGETEYARADVVNIERGKSKAQQLSEREAAAKTAEEMFQVGLWAEKNVSKGEAKRLMNRAIALDKDHAGAHGWLGHVQYKNEWMTPEQRDARMAKDQEDEMLARGLVRYDGPAESGGSRWVTPEEKAKLDAGLVLENGKWMTPAERNRLHGLEEFEGKWLPRAEALARNDVASAAKDAGTELQTFVVDDAIVAGQYPERFLKEIGEGLTRGRGWFDKTYGSAPGLELLGGRLAEFYAFEEDAPYLATVPHFFALTKTLPEGWVEAVKNTHGFFWSDPYAVSSARRWKRAEDDLAGHCYHHWGHLLLNRLDYDGRLLPPWYEEGLACLLEFRSHQRNAVFCRGRAKEQVLSGPTTGGPGPQHNPDTKVGKKGPPPKPSFDFDPKNMRDGKWKDALKAGVAAGKAPALDHLATLQFTELDSPDIASAMGIVEWLESRGALRAFHTELRRAAPPAPLRVIENPYEREACYEKAFQAAVKMGWKEADQAWRAWLQQQK